MAAIAPHGTAKQRVASEVGRNTYIDMCLSFPFLSLPIISDLIIGLGCDASFEKTANIAPPFSKSPTKIALMLVIVEPVSAYLYKLPAKLIAKQAQRKSPRCLVY